MTFLPDIDRYYEKFLSIYLMASLATITQRTVTKSNILPNLGSAFFSPMINFRRVLLVLCNVLKHKRSYSRFGVRFKYLEPRLKRVLRFEDFQTRRDEVVIAFNFRCELFVIINKAAAILPSKTCSQFIPSDLLS